MTPTAYYELSQEASRLFQQKDYAKAGEAYRRLTEAYSFDGATWFMLGRSRYEQGEFAAAAQAFVKADEMGVPAAARSNAGYAALAFARAGNANLALDWLERAILVYRHEQPLALLQNKAFDNLRAHPRFQKLAPPPVEKNISRVEGWRTDLDYLIAQIRRYDPAYSREPLPAAFQQNAERLRKQIPSLSDAQIAVELHKLLTMLGRRHDDTNVRYPRSERLKFPDELPLRFFRFPDGLYVVDAAEKFRPLVGMRVTEFDGVPTERALEALRSMEPAAGRGELDSGWIYIANTNILNVLGIAKQPDRARLTLLDREGKTHRVDVAAASGAPSYNGLRPSLIAEASAPLYLTRLNERYWFEPLPDSRAVYVRFTGVTNQPEKETLAAFGLRLRQFLEERPEVKNLIVDLRGNLGGNTYLYTELMRTIVAFDAKKGNRVFVVTDGMVFSAAMNFAVDLDRMTDAIFVGEITGSQPSQDGDPVTLTMPYSGLNFRVSTVVWNLSSPRDARRWIAPDIPVALTAKDYFSNRDRAMEAVLNFIEKSAKQE